MFRFAIVLLAGIASISGAAQDTVLPPTMDNAEAALNASTRHQEYLRLKLPSGGEVNTFVVYPERPDKAPVVIVIHEIFGMTPWVNSVADRLAAEGFIALAPDMITDMEGANPMGLVRALTREQIVERLNVVRDYALTIPAANGKVGCTGFCWGGSATWIYTTAQPDLDAAIVYYGTAPNTATLASVKAPTLGMFGENDARVNVTIDPAKAELDRLGANFNYTIFPGAGHGFLRAQDAIPANLEASKKAWPQTLAFFREHLETED